MRDTPRQARLADDSRVDVALVRWHNEYTPEMVSSVDLKRFDIVTEKHFPESMWANPSNQLHVVDRVFPDNVGGSGANVRTFGYTRTFEEAEKLVIEKQTQEGT